MKDVLTLETYPPGLYDIMRSIHEIDRNVDLYVTENGSPLNDGLRNGEGEIQDVQRIHYLESHLAQVHRAIADGLPVKGYFVWTLMDDFEWVHGYEMKFGIIEVDRRNLERKWKKSAYWYQDIIRANGFTLPSEEKG
jgi:beta-glucosidase